MYRNAVLYAYSEPRRSGINTLCIKTMPLLRSLRENLDVWNYKHSAPTEPTQRLANKLLQPY